jgi:hypothetical protein
MTEGKGTVTKTLDLHVSADDVWDVIGDYNGLARWNAGVARSDLSNGGKRRTLTLKAGGSVVEDLIDYDWKGRRYSYSIIESALPLARHKATISVVERGPNMSTVHWTCEFQPKGVDVPTLGGIFGGIFEGGLKQLEQLFGGQRPR